MSREVILAIESSCDETAAALLEGRELLGERVASQEVHLHYGGVVPELAARDHQKNMIPVINSVLERSQRSLKDLSHIAFTQGPGLLGSLLVGSSFAKGLGMALDLPLIPIHHIKAHLFANFITPPYPSFPFLGFVISGGHTQLLWVEGYSCITLLGQTLDDAVGEAFDKIARLMGFPYPGGAYIDRYAKEGRIDAFPFPMTKMKGLNFSFSGIKTAFLYFLRKQGGGQGQEVFVKRHLADLCASVQHVLVSMLTYKVEEAIKETGAKQVVIGGGVAANGALRQRLSIMADRDQWALFSPPIRYCADNAAMIGMAASYLLAEKGAISGIDIEPMGRMPL